MGVSSAVDVSAVARVTGIKTSFKDLRGGGVLFLPQRVAVIGQGNSDVVYATTKKQYTQASQVAIDYGYGSPLHLAAKQLFPDNGDGIGTIPMTLYPLVDDVSGVVSSGDITATGTAAEAGVIYVKVNNILSDAIVVDSGELGTALEDKISDAINATLDMPIIAAADGVGNKSDLTSKWKGASANDIYVEVVGSVAGLSFAITQMAGGLVNPDIDVALNQIGDVWESMLLNCMDIADTVTLEKLSVFGEGRWGALAHKQLIAFTGNTAKTVALATAVSDTRKTDKTNSQLVAPDCKNLPFVVAARELSRIVKMANNNPAHDYGSQDATGLVAGADGDQWLYADRDSAVKKGSSTVEVKDGVINLSDTVTFYHPLGEANPAYRYVVDIVKIQQVIFNINLIFASPEWDGAPLIPDDQPTTNRDAKKPKTAVAEVCAMIDSLALNAIISNPKLAKESTVAAINEQNPKRLDLSTTIQVSGNTNIKSIDLNFGFNYGSAPLV